MYQGKRIVAVVLARGGSQRIADKNLLKLGGQSLVRHAVSAALKASTIDEVVVSTNDAAIRADVLSFIDAPEANKRVTVLDRPDEISGPTSTIEQAVQHVLAQDRFAGYDYVAALQAAVPARPCGAINALVKSVIDRGTLGGVTVVPGCPWRWHVKETNWGGKPETLGDTWWDPYKYPRSQDLADKYLDEFNAVQVTPRLQGIRGHRWGSPLALLELPNWARIDIDDQSDYERACMCWAGIADALSMPREYPVHVVRSLARESHDKRTLRPLGDNLYREGFIGVVFGNGPQIDGLSDGFFRLLEDPRFVSIGVNRFAASKRAHDAGFYPSYTLAWDDPSDPPTEEQKAWAAAFKAIGGKSWRLTQDSPNANFYGPDEKLKQSHFEDGPIKEGVRMRHSTCDAAVTLLLKMGIREVYLFGIEMNDGRHLETTYPRPGQRGVWDLPAAVQASFVAWREVQAAHPELRLRCACKTSRLVTDDVVPYGVPPGAEHFGL